MKIENMPIGQYTNTDKDVKEKLKEVAKEYESVFITEMLQVMFKDDSDSCERSIYKSMLVSEYGKVAAQKIGLSDKIVSAMMKLHGV